MASLCLKDAVEGSLLVFGARVQFYPLWHHLPLLAEGYLTVLAGTTPMYVHVHFIVYSRKKGFGWRQQWITG